MLVPETSILLFPAITLISSFESTWWYFVQELRLKKSNNIERPSSLFIYEEGNSSMGPQVLIIGLRPAPPLPSIMNVHVTKNDSHAIAVLPVKK